MSQQVKFGYMAAQMVRLHKTVLSERLDKFGITYGQIGFIMQAVRHPGRTQDELSIILSIDKGATARTVAKLEKEGFLYREENPDNKRQKLVYPAEKALDVFDELHIALQESNDSMLACLDAEEKELMLGFMVRIIDSCRAKLGTSIDWDAL